MGGIWLFPESLLAHSPLLGYHRNRPLCITLCRARCGVSRGSGRQVTGPMGSVGGVEWRTKTSTIGFGVALVMGRSWTRLFASPRGWRLRPWSRGVSPASGLEALSLGLGWPFRELLRLGLVRVSWALGIATWGLGSTALMAVGVAIRVTLCLGDAAGLGSKWTA